MKKKMETTIGLGSNSLASLLASSFVPGPGKGLAGLLPFRRESRAAGWLFQSKDYRRPSLSFFGPKPYTLNRVIGL